MSFPNITQGSPIEYQNLQSPGQQAFDPIWLNIIKHGMTQGATPYPGQLSMPPNPFLMMAMNTMSGAGGYGMPQMGGFPSMPMSGPGGIPPDWFYGSLFGYPGGNQRVPMGGGDPYQAQPGSTTRHRLGGG